LAEWISLAIQRGEFANEEESGRSHHSCFGSNLSAQAHRAQRHDAGHTDLNTALISLDSVSQVTQSNIIR
jgi:hypothetical protein